MQGKSIKDKVKCIEKIKADKTILIAAYGKMSFGRVLYEAKKMINSVVVGAAYIPTKHTYAVFFIDNLTLVSYNKSNNR